MDTDTLETPSRPIPQQPGWRDHPYLPTVHRELAGRPGLVQANGTDRLHALLAQVATGEARIVMAGDCSEDPAECGSEDVARKSGLLEMLAGRVRMTTRKPVIRAARIAGQYAKPRSSPVELVEGRELPSYRGHMVNSPEPDPELRIPDPARILTGYTAAREVMRHLGWCDETTGPRDGAPIWTSHEALLLDYETPMLRHAPDGRIFLASTHWPWLGERTRDPAGAHVALLADIANPVACKIGPAIDTDELLTLCERLDPDRVPGRLTLIARMGAGTTQDRLPLLVDRVRTAGHPVVWLSDPMHGNTVSTPSGLKTRYVETIIREVQEFQAAVQAMGGAAGGLHLETTPDQVTECVPNRFHVSEVPGKYTSFCDPRLNPDQATAVASAWTA
ncbi:3-deoxy-7-phosphoheptulonate synthase [Lipingzhangella sp. LS1_29]|uniref:Phospho-2-dehydro-3-deoxyheptonate aldolase n=1 Tax=Lipingzhangella rawalii TaxID=2055835 RepID=A0ABU2H7F6_9ACTN|nr:3-deoxy-7-phosphoheptulonate synthase [Lipingzhangella rawalii]MDS1270780.1 3-deoxy-7-phosphoheptulonate synthase [Lipingzhangella rawalii]